MGNFNNKDGRRGELAEDSSDNYSEDLITAETPQASDSVTVERPAPCENVMKTSGSLGTKAVSHNGGSFQVLLVCADGKRNVEQTLNVCNVPKTVKELKKAIEVAFNIPSNDQKVTFASTLLNEGYDLEFYKLKIGDFIVVEYTSMVELGAIHSLIASLQSALTFFKLHYLQLCSLSPEWMQIRNEMIDSEKMEDCVKTAFTAASRVTRMASCEYFCNCGGLPILSDLHSLLLKRPWNKVPSLQLQMLEKAVVSVTWAVYGNAFLLPNYQSLVNVDNVIGSFLRVPVTFNVIKVPHNQFLTAISPDTQLEVLAGTIYCALGTLGSITEYKECQVKVSSSREVMDQMVGCMLTPTLSSTVRLNVMCCFENLSYNSDTHTYLSDGDLLSKMMIACSVEVPVQFNDMDPMYCARMECCFMKYFATMTIAQLAQSGNMTHHITEVNIFLQDFLSNADHNALHTWATSIHSYKWNDLVPILRLLYNPYMVKKCDHDNRSEEQTLYGLCQEAAVLALQVVLAQDEERQILINQGLVDYLVCALWHMPKGSRASDRAKSLMEMVMRTEVSVGPPRLSVIARSQLAALHFGLEKAMNLDCHQLLQEMIP